jgi:hypothetical protein
MKKMKTVYVAMTAALLSLSAFAGDKMTEKSLKEKISSWPVESREATDFMIKKYGLPAGVTDEMLVWIGTKPFKRSIVYKEAITHNFPMEHKDVLEQFIDYKAPSSDKVARIWEFDGSVILGRTSGEMSARCDKEAANLLALNLANDVINGKRTAEEARMEYGKQIMAMKDGKPEEYTKKLVFTPAGASSGDSDRDIMSEVKSMQAEEAKEMTTEE